MANKKREPDYFPLDLLLGGKLYLPSFGTSVAKSAPKTLCVPAGTSVFDTTFLSGDAFSISYAHEGGNLSPADQDFPPLDARYLRAASTARPLLIMLLSFVQSVQAPNAACAAGVTCRSETVTDEIAAATFGATIRRLRLLCVA